MLGFILQHLHIYPRRKLSAAEAGSTLDPHVRVLAHMCWHALEDANIDPSRYQAPSPGAGRFASTPYVQTLRPIRAIVAVSALLRQACAVFSAFANFH